MIRGIDHLVIACDDPDAAAGELERAVGIACTGGGRHEAFGTWNRLAFLADGNYLELIGVEDRRLALQSPVGAATLRTLDEHGGGLATWAALVEDLGAEADALAGAGFGPVTHGSRRRDDGELVEWWTAFPEAPLSPTTPFLIQHAYAGAEWGPAAMEARERFAHPIGSSVRLSRLSLAVADPPAIAAALGGSLGVEGHAVADLGRLELGAHELHLVPRREVPVPAVVTLRADVESPRTVELLGLRFDVERAPVAAREAHRA